jgi:hypothetical protein
MTKRFIYVCACIAMVLLAAFVVALFVQAWNGDGGLNSWLYGSPIIGLLALIWLLCTLVSWGGSFVFWASSTNHGIIHFLALFILIFAGSFVGSAYIIITGRGVLTSRKRVTQP